MATSRQQTRRWSFGIHVQRSRNLVRTYVSCSACLFIFVYFVTLSYNFENDSTSKWEDEDSINSHRVNQRKLKSERFLSGIRNEANNNTTSYYPSKPNDKRSSLNFNMKISKDFRCPLVSPLLVGWMDISLMASASRQESEETFNSRMTTAGLKFGGRYKPRDCKARSKVAIVVPYRGREFHLKIFLRYMHPFLQRQQLEYAIVVVEQSADGLPFNRGLLMNIGFREAQKQDRFQCYIFHDVDLLPEDDGNTYACPDVGKPRQMAFSIDIYDYKPTPIDHFGGVSAFATSDFQRVNGFSNVFFGWGSEDDDLYRRLLHNNLTVTRMSHPSLTRVIRYRMFDHPVAKPNPDRMRLFDQGIRRLKSDGLNDLRYRRLSIKFKPLYTYVIVDVQPQMHQTKMYQTKTLK